jgi:hypothetical protein
VIGMVVGQSDDVDPRVAIDEAIAQVRGQLGGQTPRAALLFVAYESFDPKMIAAVRAAFPDVVIAGGTSAAEMNSSGGYREDSVSLALLTSDSVDMTAGIADGLEDDLELACRSAVDQARGGTVQDPRLCLVLVDPINGQRAVEALGEMLPPDVLIVGGASSGPALGERPTFQFSGDEVVQNGLVVLVLSGPLTLSVAVGTGLRPIGPRGTVTRSSYGRIEEIDGRPAVAFIAGYLDGVGPQSFGNPLAVRDTPDTEPYLRVLLGRDDQAGALLIPGGAPVGALVQLTTASSDELVDAASDTVRRALQAFPSGATPTAALMFSCAVRKFLLGSRTSQELSGARGLLPASLPIAGMYCVGEIAPVAGSQGSSFHNESFVTVLLGD